MNITQIVRVKYKTHTSRTDDFLRCSLSILVGELIIITD